MRRKLNLTFFFLILLISLFMIPTNQAATYPTISVDPPHPKPKGVVNFTVTISDTEITDSDNVFIIVEECAPGLCFVDNFNQSMTKNTDGTYAATITLRHANAVEMRYRIGYKSPTSWTWYPANMSNLISITLDTNNSDIEDNNSISDTPGFGAFSVLVAVGLLAFILHRHKS